MGNDIAGSNPSSVCKHLFCPVTGLPVQSRHLWSHQKLGSEYQANLCIVGQAILHSAPSGTIGLQEMRAGLSLTREVTRHINNGIGPFVMIEDLSGLANLTLTARKDFIAHCLQNQRLSALIFCNASPLMKISIKIGKRFNTRGIKIQIAENYADAVTLALQVCIENDLDTGPLRFDPIPALQADHRSLSPVELRSDDAWRVRAGDYSNRSVLIDSTIMYSQSKGYLEPGAIAPIHRLRCDVREATPQGAHLEYIIVDVSHLQRASRLARKQYMQSLKEWCARYPLNMYIIIGENTFMRTALLMAKPFMPFRVAIADDVDNAFALVRKDRDQGVQRTPKDQDTAPTAKAEASDRFDIEKILAYIGGIDWEKKGIDIDMPLEKDNRLQTIVQAIQLIKDELDDLLSERETAEAALIKTDQKYRELFEKGSDWLCIHDLDGNFIETNFDFKHEMAWKGFESSRLNLRDIIPKRFQVQVNDYLKRIQQKGHDKGILNVLAKDGRERVLEYNNVLVSDDKGEFAWVKSWARDVTSEIKAAEEKERLQKRLQQSQKMESIGTLAGGIAHDFNNILSSVIGYTELALQDAEEGQLPADKLQEVLKAGNRAKELVHQILTFARQSDEKRRPIQVSLIAKEVLKLLRSSLPATIDIQQRIESDALVLGNPSQVHQILMNLCTNSAYAMEDQGGFLKVCIEEVRIEAGAADKLRDLEPGPYLKLSVADTGPGIAPDIIDSIFEPYFTTKKPDQGTGMGLAIVHGIVKGYDGDVYVESRPGSGAVFTVLIPVTTKNGDTDLYQQAVNPTGNESILLVDDDLPVLKVSYSILDRLGYRVTTRSSSTDALALFESQPERFDLVISDMTMPDLTGDRLAMEMLKIRPDLPIIMCTGYHKKISELRAAEIGIKALIYKPIVMARLATTVRNVLDHSLM